MSATIRDGIINNNVTFVDSPEKANYEVVYDKKRYDKKTGNILYFRRDYLVAIK